MEFGVVGGFGRVPLFDDDALVAGSVELLAEAGVGEDGFFPNGGIPEGLASDAEGLAVESGYVGRFGVEDTELFVGGLVELFDDILSLVWWADGASGEDSDMASVDIADDGVLVFGEPLVNDGIDDLVGGGVGAVFEDEVAGGIGGHLRVFQVYRSTRSRPGITGDVKLCS